MKAKRPVNLNLFTIRLPLPAIVSILHRISGIILFLGSPILLFFLQQSLHSEETFNQLKTLFSQPMAKGLWILFLAGVTYHLVAGIRHVVMDLGYGESLKAGRATSAAVILVTIVLTLMIGVWL
ncbi:MAG: succinate dehydrogenase, cytochrome b556 subunit [Proteobacteria bacterium]|nr:succinate dehydrogenase, cytochrome b556 subunit [Pseudomonadota bacterium]